MKHLISVPPKCIPYFHKFTGYSPDNWFVSADPEGQKVGSGGGTAFLFSELWKKEEGGEFATWLKNTQRIVIHAGGKSRRLPAYAPIGKSLMPMPVFRWSRGQALNQRLVNLQVPLFEKILKKAPSKLNTLIASGDTLIFEGATLPEIPDADIVCFGLWLEPEKATNHGVFFTSHESPAELEFMLQKPSIGEIRKLIHQYYFLMDIGIWLLSPRAVRLLMKKSGWEGDSFQNQIPADYDLYAQFGAAMGTNPSEQDEEINDLKVRLVNLEGGGFYHLGNTSELISSNLAIQNRVIDQREIWHKNIKPHPSIFVLNAKVGISFNNENRNIWIENSSVPASWSLSQNHAVTGVPDNNWDLNLPKGKCIDVVPLDGSSAIIRNYGFSDTFRGNWQDATTRFSEIPLLSWLKSHGLEEVFNNSGNNKDIQELPLFPVLTIKKLNPAFIQWLVDDLPSKNDAFSKLWKDSRRLSADEICEVSNLQLV
ncbi:MAG TPA: L-fucokinase, partial [Prolixibacteraceae bacterium]|nr:L-fucokinase [Prolixibacteraceae bacterium]